ncbi:MAG TPA: thiolase family protein [Tepidisphaeraceae bacterium]|nr:thiolase family protein [Tepidisphaeraceae bacterium]
MADDVILAGAARTAIGTFNGAFSEVPATALGSAAIKASIVRAAIAPEQVDEVIIGNVLSAGLGQNPARQAAIGAGLSVSVPATTINKVCGSGLKAVMLAAQAIRAGDAWAIVAGGMENMTRGPYLLDRARNGYRLGHGQLIDSAIRDGLWDVYNDVHMGACGDRCAEAFHFSREQQDDFAIESFRRARAAIADGLFAAEIVPIEAPVGKMKQTIDEDEQPRRFDEAKMRRLPPAFGSEGTITAANASSLSDGAASVIVMSARRAAELSVRPQARILGCATAAREPEWFTTAPIGAVQKLLDQLHLNVSEVDLFEINEAFAVVAMAAMQELSIPHDKVHVHGGAVALGHPIGASGARTLVTLLHAMLHRKARLGVVTLCIGGGEAVAMAVERFD